MAQPVTGTGIVVRDYQEFRRKVKDLDKNLDKELKAGLRDIGREVSTDAGERARSLGLKRTGALAKKIAPSVKMQSVDIVSKAKRPPAKRPGLRGGRFGGIDYPYPMVYEYGGKGKRRPFLAPTVEASGDVIKKQLQEVLDDTARKAGWT
jgi:hypothetical protein